MAPSPVWAAASFYTCCQCLAGPMRWELEVACWECDHRRCNRCQKYAAKDARSDASLSIAVLFQDPYWQDTTKDQTNLDFELITSSPCLATSEEEVGSARYDPGTESAHPGTSDFSRLPLDAERTFTADDEATGSDSEGTGLVGCGPSELVSEPSSPSRLEIVRKLEPLGFWTWWRKEPDTLPGTVRIRFRCACGKVICDDYPEAAKKVAQILEQYLHGVSQRVVDSGSPSTSGAYNNGLKSRISALHAKLFGRRGISNSIGGRSAADTDSEAQLRSNSRSDRNQEPFYLTCLRKDARIPSLEQSAAKSIQTDLDYFDMLRSIARSTRCASRWILNLRKIAAIHYVKFVLLFDNKYVDIRKVGDLPKDKEQYQPCCDDFAEHLNICPWGPHILLHYFEKRHDCWEHPRILVLIPKKLRGQLLVPNGLLSKEGWGMQLVDCIDGQLVALIGSMGLILCIALGILWAKLHDNDFQTGTALAQCFMVLVSFLATVRGVVSIVEQRS